LGLDLILGVGIVVALRILVGCSGLRSLTFGLRAQNDLAGRSLALVADHEDIVAGAFEKLGNYDSRAAWPVCAEDALVWAETLNSCACESAHFPQNLLQAGIRSIDAEALAVPDYGCG
jgi:hypothetical protein